MLRIYRLAPGRELPGHEAGDIVYERLDQQRVYVWANMPFYQHEAAFVELHPDFFQEFTHHWETGQPLHFISVHGKLLEQPFDVAQHATLVVQGNAYTTQEQAQRSLERIRRALDSTTVLWELEEVQLLKYYVQNAQLEDALKLLNKKL